MRRIALLCLLCLPATAPAQRLSDMTQTFVIQTNWLFMVTVPGVTNYKATFATLVEEIQGSLPDIATNGVSSLATNGIPISNVATQLNLVAGSNIEFRGTNAGGKTSVGVGLKTNLSFFAGAVANELVLGNWGIVFGISNVATAQLSFHNDDPAAGDDWVFADHISADSATFSAMPGSGSYVAVAAGGQLYKTNVTGGIATNIGVGGTIFLDAAIGNDATAQRTNMAKPYLTASNAVASLQSGDTLVVRGGTSTLNSRQVTGNNPTPALGFTNLSNIRIVGEPSSVWAMGGLKSNNLAYSCPGLWFERCTNVIIEGMTFVGVRTNAPVTSHCGIGLQYCDGVTFVGNTFSNWQDHAVSTLNFYTVNRKIQFFRNTFKDIGGINHVTLGGDGTAIAVDSTNFVAVNNLFIHNFRDIEFCCDADSRGILLDGNISEEVVQGSIMLTSTNVSEVKIVNNKAKSYATNAYLGPMWLQVRAGSNVTVQGNQVSGFNRAIEYAPENGTRCVDWDILDNTWSDLDDIGIAMQVPIGNSALLDRIRIMRNTVRNCVNQGISFNGRNSRVEDNTLIDCNTGAGAGGFLRIGFVALTTNTTNITLAGNRFIGSSAQPAILLDSGSYSNAVWGNEIDRRIIGGTLGITDNSAGTLNMPLNKIAAIKILRSDANSRLGDVTIGTNIIWDGTTLSASGGGGGGGDVTTAQLNSASNAVVVLSSNNVRVAAGSGTTVSSSGAGGVQTFTVNATSGSAGGTNFPPVLTTGTNITVGTGVRKSLTMSTNISTAISFNGTEILGEVVTLVVTNTSATASNITVSFFQDAVASSYFDATVASNVTGFMVVSNSTKTLMFVYNGSAWRLESTLGKEMELYVAGGLVMTTNAGTSIVTLSNSLSLNQLNNVTIGTPANNDVLLWNSTASKWINSLSPGGDIVSNITVSTTNNILLDFGAANVFKLTLLTNWSETFTNVTTLTKRGYVYYQQDTNGGRILNRYAVAGGMLQTNATQNMQPTTNANALDLLELMPGFFTTNLMAWWPQDFQPRIRFTNSLFAFASFLDNFNRSNADPMSTTASDGHTWTSGPGSMGEPRIISSMLFGNAGVTGARVLTPTIGANQKASLTLIGNTGHLGPMVRMQSTVDDSGYILVSTDANHLTIYRLDDTALTVLFTSSSTPTISNGDTITLSINGTGGAALLECFLNGVSYGTVADPTYSGGQPGIWMDSDTASGGPFSAIEQ